MKTVSARLVGPRAVELVTSDAPVLGDDQVLVQVVACGVCTSELPVFRGEAQGVPGSSFRYARYPCSLGHEVAGIVVDVGAGVRGLRSGDRVTGVPYSGSGFATHVVEPEACWTRVPDGVPLECALGEPLMAAVNIVRTAAPEFGDAAILVGDGFMSLLVVAALARHPLRVLVLSGHHDDRLGLAREFGASHTVNAKREDAYWAIREILDGPAHDATVTPWPGGTDLAFEFAGKMAALQLCASLCKPKQRARLVMPSFYGPEPFTIGHYLMNRGPSLVVCHPAHSRDLRDDLRRAMWALEAGVFPVRRLITHAFGLDRVPDAFAACANRVGGYIKGIVVPDFGLLESPGSYRTPNREESPCST